MKYGLILLTSLLASSSFAKATQEIYGYAIRCQTEDASVKISARQWDDDFAFQSRGLGTEAEFVFMESDQKYDLAAHTLKFTPSDGDRGLEFLVTKSSERSAGGIKADGKLAIDHQTVDLACEVKYGVDEEDFDNKKLAEWADSILEEPTVWGGSHIELSVDGQSADIKFDCARAHIDGGWIPKKGVVATTGTMIKGSGVNPPPGHKPKPVPAKFRAVISGKDMKLTVSTKDSSPTVYTLVKGKQGRLFRCL